MTIICAMHQPGVGTWIGSDRRVTAGMTIVSDCTPKWALVDGGAIAVIGSNTVRTVAFERAGEVSAEWRATKLAGWLRSIWTELGVEPKAEPGEAAWFNGGSILASPKRIMPLCSAFGASEVAHGRIYASGSGCDFAEGAAFAMQAQGVTDGETIIRTAILAAISGDAACGGEPFVHLLRE